ncbi:hypothetical protein [Carp edema virus]|nr:hypothetical protein [Carp edema virus]
METSTSSSVDKSDVIVALGVLLGIAIGLLTMALIYIYYLLRKILFLKRKHEIELLTIVISYGDFKKLYGPKKDMIEMQDRVAELVTKNEDFIKEKAVDENLGNDVDSILVELQKCPLYLKRQSQINLLDNDNCNVDMDGLIPYGIGVGPYVVNSRKSSLYSQRSSYASIGGDSTCESNGESNGESDAENMDITDGLCKSLPKSDDGQSIGDDISVSSLATVNSLVSTSGNPDTAKILEQVVTMGVNQAQV